MRRARRAAQVTALGIAIVAIGCNESGTIVVRDMASPIDAPSPEDSASPPDLALLVDMAVDAAMPVDSAIPVDQATQVDLAIPVDQAIPVDSSIPVDLANPVDLAIPVDFGTPPDLIRLADLSTAPDLTVACTALKTTFDWSAPLKGWNDPFATRIVSAQYGMSAGFGQTGLPAIVLGPPSGAGASMGSLDVLSLGNQGVIVLALEDVNIADGPGPDLVVFENATSFFSEPGYVAVSDDGIDWHEWPCNPSDTANKSPGCAGTIPVYANATNKLDPTVPATAGGNAFDLAAVGLSRARYVRIRDGGLNWYNAPSGGFDLDAIAVVNGMPASCP